MTRRKVNLRDHGFAHHTKSAYATLYGNSDLFEWDRSCSSPGPTVCTDGYLNDEAIPAVSGDAIAWLTEPVAIAPAMYLWVAENLHRFVEVWSHNEDTLRLVRMAGVSAVFVHGASCFVDPPSQKIGRKTKLVSFIGSSKNWTSGHLLRQKVRAMLPAFVDAFGHGFVAVAEKSDALRDYAYSIAIENSVQDSYFTEKLVDCFTTGTVPIYWGTRTIHRHFDMAGVIQFHQAEDLPEILRSLSIDDYRRRGRAILRNYEIAFRYHVPEEFGVRGSAFFQGKSP